MVCSRQFFINSKGVSPVIAVIITVAITVILASVAYVWFSSLTEDVGESVVEPLSVTPELNTERVIEELRVEITIGKNIDWADYRVMLNDSEVQVTSKGMTNEGDTVYFDYRGGRLVEGNFYTLDIIDIDNKMVVFSKSIQAKSYTPDGTGIYGYVIDSGDGTPISNIVISLYKNDLLVNTTTPEYTNAYKIEAPEGSYDLVCEHTQQLLGPSFHTYNAKINITKYYMLNLNIEMDRLIPVTAALSGHVYDNQTNTPLANIVIKITDFRTVQKSQTTDSNGYYEFDLPPLNYSLICDNKGYVYQSTNISIVKNQTVIHDFYLITIPPQTGKISGHVFDDRSKPLENIEVYTKSQYMTNYTITDVNGTFSINVVPGDVLVFVNSVGFNYWAQMVSIEEFENQVVDIYLEKEPGG